MDCALVQGIVPFSDGLHPFPRDYALFREMVPFSKGLQPFPRYFAFFQKIAPFSDGLYTVFHGIAPFSEGVCSFRGILGAMTHRVRGRKWGFPRAGCFSVIWGALFSSGFVGSGFLDPGSGFREPGPYKTRGKQSTPNNTIAPLKGFPPHSFDLYPTIF